MQALHNGAPVEVSGVIEVMHTSMRMAPQTGQQRAFTNPRIMAIYLVQLQLLA